MKPTLLVVGSALGLFLAACCCGGTGWDIRKAEKAAAEGRYDEAITIYEQILVEHPDSKKAPEVSDAITEAMIARTGALWGASEWENAGRSYLEVTGRFADPGEAADAIWGATGTNVVLAADYVLFLDDGMTDENLEGMAIWLKDQRELLPEGLRDDASGWLCGHRAEFHAYSTCRDVNPDIANLDQIDPAAGVADGEIVAPMEATERLDEAEAACSRLALLVSVCEGEDRDEIEAIVNSGALGELKANVDARVAEWRAYVDAKQAEWEAECQRESEDALRRASRLGDTCARTVRRLEDLEEKWLYPILTNQRNAVINSVFEMKPHNEKHSETEDALQEIEDEVEAAEWPDEIQQTTLEGVRTEQGRCNR